MSDDITIDKGEQSPAPDPLPAESPASEPSVPVDVPQGTAPETANLADSFSPEDAQACVDWVCKGYDRDYDSLSEWRERRDRQLKLYLGMMPPAPADEMRTQVHLPIITKAHQRIKARIYDQQFPSNGEYFGAKPTDATDLERCVRVAKHMNWQIEHQIPQYVPNHDVLISQWSLYGSAFSYMYWDPETNRPCHEACRTDDIVISYTERPDDPCMANVAQITRVLRKYRHELLSLQKKGYYTNVDKIYAPDTDATKVGPGSNSQQEQPTRETIDKFQGTEKADTDLDAARVLLEMHCWYKLPGGDDERPVVITIDKVTRTLLCVKVREDEDPEDRARYDREKTANETAYQAAMETYNIDMAHYMAGMQLLAAQSAQTMTEPPLPGEGTSTQLPMPGPQSATMPNIPPAPQPPNPPMDPDPIKMIPIHFFTHFIFEPNPEGFYGLGIGSLLEGFNIAADTLMSQVCDAGTLSNTSTMIASDQIKLDGGEMKIRPGIVNRVALSPHELATGMVPVKFSPPEPQLGKIVEMLLQAGDDVSGASEILSGEVGGSNETATTTQIRISQALAAISIQNKRYTRARTVEGRHLARLNSVHLEDVEYFSVVDPFKQIPGENGQPMPAVDEHQISRMDYLEDVDITITADPRMASQPQRFQEALQAIQTFSQIAPTVPALQGNVTFWNALAKNLCVAMDRPDLVAALFSPPPMPPPSAQPPQGPTQQQGQGSQRPPPGQGAPRPKPQNPGPRVPNGGATPAEGQPFMGQGQ